MTVPGLTLIELSVWFTLTVDAARCDVAAGIGDGDLEGVRARFGECRGDALGGVGAIGTEGDGRRGRAGGDPGIGQARSFPPGRSR